MIAAILSFAIEMIFMIVINVMKGSLSRGGALFIIVVFILCTIVSIISIIYNAYRIKEGYISRGVCVTGLVFSIVGTVIGLIFCISVLASFIVSRV